MKTLIYVLGISLVMLLTNSTSAEVNDSTKVVKKIIKTIQIDDNGKTIIDTIVYVSEDFNVKIDKDVDFFHRGMHKKFEDRNHVMKKYWIDENEKEYNITIETDGDSSKVIVMKCPHGSKREIILNNDAINEDEIFMFNDKIFPPIHQYKKIRKLKNNNLIDLNDPSIISFEKEETKNGDEKITIIRRKTE